MKTTVIIRKRDQVYLHQDYGVNLAKLPVTKEIWDSAQKDEQIFMLINAEGESPYFAGYLAQAVVGGDEEPVYRLLLIDQDDRNLLINAARKPSTRFVSEEELSPRTVN